jgi:type VI secretion system secreted protein Hcp
MAEHDKDAPAERVQRFRFRVVAPDGRELLSDIAQVVFAPKTAALFRVTSIFVAAKGKKLGALKGESTRKGTEHQFAALSLDYELSSPRDLATGQATGKRRHSPVSIVKEWGAASPQLFQALVGNEVLEAVDIDCHGTLEDGKTAIVHKLKLSNASVASILQSGGGDAGPRELETVAFTFGKIEQLTPDGAVLASDSWGAAGA